MKVDMSPAAVRQRLKTLEQLWVLSVKLMSSKKIPVEKERAGSKAGKEKAKQKEP
jgi:hypothetical protein